MPMDRPQLRPHIRQLKSAHDSRQIYLSDQLGLAEALPLTMREASWLAFFDGQNTLQDIQLQAMQRMGKELILLEDVARLAVRLEEKLFLDSARFQSIASAPVRPPRFLGCYEAQPEALRRQLRNLFTRPQGAGLPKRSKPDGTLRAALIPHIDYQRGGLSYTHAFREVFEKTDASLFVIIGTSHHSSHRFTVTRKHFETPLGIAPTDQDYVDRLVKHYGPGLFDDEWLAHFPEHSIELEVVFLQFLYETARPIRIVPIVVGSFHDCVALRAAPEQISDIARMITALQRTEAETDEPICYIISGDLAHIGPKFNPGQTLDDQLLAYSFRQDQTILRRAESVDREGYFRTIAIEGDQRNICGLPPTYTTLEAIKPGKGKVLHYDRYVHPQGHESVSFASVAFYR